jgi:hypothetical protein
MSKYFKDEFIYNEESKKSIGLPRPYVDVDESLYKKNNVFHLHKRVPIPWQSEPAGLDNFLNIIHENEDKIYSMNLCPYCGKQFLPDEESIRWISKKRIPKHNGPSVFSDSHPFHIECMKQARIFCPFMRNTKDKEFEIGLFYKLKIDANVYKQKVIEYYKNNIRDSYI